MKACAVEGRPTADDRPRRRLSRSEIPPGASRSSPSRKATLRMPSGAGPARRPRPSHDPSDAVRPPPTMTCIDPSRPPRSRPCRATPETTPLDFAPRPVPRDRPAPPCSTARACLAGARDVTPSARASCPGATPRVRQLSRPRACDRARRARHSRETPRASFDALASAMILARAELRAPSMAKKEKFGKFVLLEEVETLGPRHRVPRGQAQRHRPREDRHRAAPQARASPPTPRRRRA